MRRRITALLLVAIAGLFGACGGMASALARGVREQQHPSDPRLLEYLPLPHHVPKSPAGVSFRFAMAHDVVHERFPKHGPAHYTERNRVTRAKLAALPADNPATYPLVDDLAVGLDRLGKPADAVPLLRDKLARQRTQGLTGRDLYTTEANLGSVLTHDNLERTLAGDPTATAAFREGIGHVKASLAANPDAHFGREQWQVAIYEFLLAAAAKPDLLKTFDFVGNRLDTPYESLTYEANPRYYGTSRPTVGYGRAYNWDAHFWHIASQDQRAAVGAIRNEPPVNDPTRAEWWERLKAYRDLVTRVGAETGWAGVPVPSHREQVPFDEPLLGIIGMWRQGGGANPHFALCIGETMLRVGQRFIAWAAYERAARMSERFWPDPSEQQFLRDHCARRQREIEATLSPADVAALRPQFDAELAFGEQYQREYQEHEGKKLAAGADVFDDHVFDDFRPGQPPVASTPGPEEWYAHQSRPLAGNDNQWRLWSFGLLGAGLGAMLTAEFVWLKEWRRQRITPALHSSDGTGSP